MRADRVRLSRLLVPAALALAICCAALAPAASAASARTAHDGADRGNRPARVLILHNSPEPPADVATIDNLLSHFPVTTETAHSSELDGLAEGDADYIIHIDSIGASDREIAEAASVARRWNIPYMVFRAGAADRVFDGILLRYGNAEYATTAISAAALDPGPDGVGVAWLSDGRSERPLIVREGDRWQVAAGLANGMVAWLAADVLHDFLGEHHPEGATGLIVIENVGPLSDPAHLRRLADLLREYRMPFTAAVQPARRSSVPSERAVISDNPELADALRYMTEAGGTIVLDGSRLDPAKPDESAGLIARDIALLQEVGGYPVALYASRALAESLAYASDRAYFSNIIEFTEYRADRTRYSDIPYTRIRGADGTAFPESVGAASGDAEATLLASRMSRLGLVRDALSVVGLDASLPYGTIAAQLEQIAREAVMWRDIRYSAYRVETGFIRLSGRGDGTMDAVILNRDRMVELQKLEKQSVRYESITYYSSWTLVLVVAVFVVMFMLFIVIMQMRRNRRLFMERELG
jgi:hypothetical protein